MKKHLVLLSALAALGLGFADQADAHALLRSARPGVGSTVTAPKSITIEFSEGVVPRFSGITIADSASKPVRVGKATNGGAASSLVAPIEAALAPGTYVVSWHAVSVDSHRTQGTFRFTVQP